MLLFILSCDAFLLAVIMFYRWTDWNESSAASWRQRRSKRWRRRNSTRKRQRHYTHALTNTLLLFTSKERNGVLDEVAVVAADEDDSELMGSIFDRCMRTIR